MRITCGLPGGRAMVDLIIRSGLDPGTHYLLHEGLCGLIGAERPWLDSGNLSNVHYVTYAARRWRGNPAYVTVPKGNPPFPMVVMPHGGPFVRETVIFDEWAQMLANNGFLVLPASIPRLKRLQPKILSNCLLQRRTRRI